MKFMIGKLKDYVACQTVLRNSYRARVFLVHEKEFLAVKDRLSNGEWKLPGGGIKNKESPKSAAAREIYEELSLSIPESDFIHLGTANSSKQFPFTQEILKVNLKEKPTIKASKLEISKTKWLDLSNLPKNVSPIIAEKHKLL